MACPRRIRSFESRSHQFWPRTGSLPWCKRLLLRLGTRLHLARVYYPRGVVIGPKPVRSKVGTAAGIRRSFRGEVRNGSRSEEHTSELQSRFDLVCRLLLEKINP